MALCLVLGLSTLVCIAKSQQYANLPDDWELLPSKGQMIRTGTMPQGASASPDGKTLAVISSGFNQPALLLYRAGDLRQLASIPLTGAFGRPLWTDQRTVLVAGANADAIFKVDVLHHAVQTIPLGKGSYPTSITRAKRMVAVATDGTLSVKIGPLNDLGDAKSVRIGGHVGGLSFSSDGSVLYASNRSSNYVDAIDVKSLRISKIGADLHPSDVLTVGNCLYIAETGADAVGLYDIRTGGLKQIFVGDKASGTRLSGVSPNALAFEGNTLFVSLGAANSIALVRNGRLAGRAPAGWYPTDVVPIGNRLYVIDGKGEGTTPNPYFRAQAQGFHGYIGTIEFGSIRIESLSRDALSGNPQGSRGWGIAARNTVVRPDGPIRHVFFILKENRSYDQVLGDVAAGNGDPTLAWFGMPVTSNEHGLASQFGLFDNAYTSGEVSETGHDWSDAAFVDDYVQRTWPLNYANRGNPDFSFPGILAIVPKNGYIWQDAFRHRVSFRDYGEMTNIPDVGVQTLKGHYDKRYKPFDLKYSDVDRVGEWRREFEKFVSAGNLPQFELIWLANDHTAGSKPGFLTPRAFVAQKTMQPA